VVRPIKIFFGAILLTVAAAALLYGSGLIADRASEEAGWKAIKWPFLMDAWPEGQAFHCGSTQCGMEVKFIFAQKSVFATVIGASATMTRSIVSATWRLWATAMCRWNPARS
jgi:hypothetical protein